MPDPLTPEHKERIRKAIDREAGTGGLSPAAAAVWISYCEALLAALAAAEAERDAAKEEFDSYRDETVELNRLLLGLLAETRVALEHMVRPKGLSAAQAADRARAVLAKNLRTPDAITPPPFSPIAVSAGGLDGWVMELPDDDEWLISSPAVESCEWDGEGSFIKAGRQIATADTIRLSAHSTTPEAIERIYARGDHMDGKTEPPPGGDLDAYRANREWWRAVAEVVAASPRLSPGEGSRDDAAPS